MISGRSSLHDDEDAVKPSEANVQEQIQPVPYHSHTSARVIVPFIAAHDIPRGAIYALQAFLSYALMLAVM